MDNLSHLLNNLEKYFTPIVTKEEEEIRWKTILRKKPFSGFQGTQESNTFVLLHSTFTLHICIAT